MKSNDRRLGVAIGKREVRALLIRSGAVEWHAKSVFSDTGNLADSLREVLAKAPRLPVGMRVTVVVAPAWVQVKPLLGLPSLASPRLATQLLRENQRSFFLYNRGGPALIADIHTVGGTAWGAAFDKDVVEQATRAFHALGLKPRRVAPAAVAIVTVMSNRLLRWADADDCFELEGDSTGIRRLERVPPIKGAAAPTPTTLARLGDDAPQFIDAYAAAVAPRRLALSWQLQSDEAQSRARARARGATTMAGICAAAAFAALGPGMRARAYAQAARDLLTRDRRVQIELAKNESELRRVTDVLARVESFRVDRGSVLRTLGELAQSVPDSTAFLTFHVDSVEGAFTAIAPHVADILPALVDARDIVGPRILGSVTRETIGGVRVERATFRFRRRGQSTTHRGGVAP